MKFLIRGFGLILILGTSLVTQAAENFTTGPGWIDFPGKGSAKNIVLLVGDEEYRSEESLPMLARILSERYGFHCTVLFSIDEATGAVNPNNQKSLARPEVLGQADAIVMALRFRRWPDATLSLFDTALKRGIPVIGLRTSTHAFQKIEGPYKDLNNFGKNFLGEKWVAHWGNHKVEGTRTMTETKNAQHPVLNGVTEIFGDTDVYEAYPPADAQILLRGQVLQSLDSQAALSQRKATRKIDQVEQGVNNPAMPVVWTREVAYAGEIKNRVLCITMGAATDFKNESLRRLVLNGVYWGLKLEVPAKADVTPMVTWNPSRYSTNGFHRGFQAKDFIGELPAK